MQVTWERLTKTTNQNKIIKMDKCPNSFKKL